MQAGSAYNTVVNDCHEHVPLCQVRQHMLWREVLSHRGDHVGWIVNGIGDPNGAQDCATYAIHIARLGTSNYWRHPHVDLPLCRSLSHGRPDRPKVPDAQPKPFLSTAGQSTFAV